MHIMVGGLWGMNEKEWVAPLAENEDWFLLASKYMWRQGYVRCPETCSMDAPVSDCFCECPSDVLAGMSSTEALNRTGVLGLFGGGGERRGRGQVGAAKAARGAGIAPRAG